LIKDAHQFIDQGWAAQAVGLGWSALDLFGCHPQAPFARIAQQGLLWLLNGRRLVVLTAEFAAIEAASGGRLTCRRAPIETGQVLAWDLGQVREAAHE